LSKNRRSIEQCYAIRFIKLTWLQNFIHLFRTVRYKRVPWVGFCVRGGASMAKVWLKFVLWASIIFNIVAAGQINSLHFRTANEIGDVGASIVSLCMLFIYGTILGSIYFGIQVLIVGKNKIIERKPTNGYCIGLGITIVLLAFIGNLATLIMFGCYQIVKIIAKKIKKH